MQIVNARKKMRLRMPSACAKALLFSAVLCLTFTCNETSTLVGLTPAGSQELGSLSNNIDPNAQMLLEADSLTFDRDREIVTAQGNVKIDYDGNHLVAQKISYSQKTNRLKASGNVEIIEKTGNRIYAETIDVTDDFAEGFVKALRVEAPDNTRFAAQSAERRDGNVTIFKNGVYTACEPCEDKPDSAPIWRIRAKRIVWDGKEKTIRFKHTRFEMFGMPIAWFPHLEIPDPTVKQKTGFLFPRIAYSSPLGAGLTTPFNIAINPTSDILLLPTYYYKQGLLTRAKFRKRFNSGALSITAAGIYQLSPEEFTYEDDDISASKRFRAMIGSQGHFNLNQRWAFGWDLLAQSDKSFSHIYSIPGYNAEKRRDEIYLTGLHDRNYFDMRFMHFEIQETALNSSAAALHWKQPWVLPQFDYQKIFEDPIAGGQLSLTANAQVLHRIGLNAYNVGLPTLFGPYSNKVIPGTEGTNGRVSGELEWKKNFVSDSGVIFTTLLAARIDGAFANMNDNSREAIDNINQAMGITTNTRNAWFRYMATAGMEVRWPILFSTTSAFHVFEPTAQLFIRPDAPYQSVLGFPNEDAQSLVFDASNLFERDKFSGWDRIEGGVRANLGLRYSGTFSNGWSAHALIGQSFHLAGDNPYAQPDLLNVSAYSGLESNRSDYVGLFGVSNNKGFSASIATRLDKDTFNPRRIQARAALSGARGSISASYIYAKKRDYYNTGASHTVSLSSTLKFNENWSALASGTYNIADRYVSSNSLGLSYKDECFGLKLTYGQARTSADDDNPTQTFGFLLSLRTLGDFGNSVSVASEDE